MLASLGLGACVINGDETEAGAGAVPMDGGVAGRAVDSGGSVCTPGATQVCYGPGACEGAQRCELHGLSWGPCDCGGGGAGSGSPAGGAPNEGGAGGATAASSCSDGMRNGAESDVDCGGPDCPPCATGQQCDVGTDCSSGVCRAQVCGPSDCADGVRDGDETDVDCGGGTCPACADLMSCSVDADCASGSCIDGVCVAA